MFPCNKLNQKILARIYFFKSQQKKHQKKVQNLFKVTSTDTSAKSMTPIFLVNVY